LKDEPTFFKNCRIRRFSETQTQQLQNIHFSTGNIIFYQTHPKNTTSGKCGFGAASAKVD